MVTGFQWVDSEKAWHDFNKDKNCQPVGSMMRCHWITENGKRYYLKEDGVMAASRNCRDRWKQYDLMIGRVESIKKKRNPGLIIRSGFW